MLPRKYYDLNTQKQNKNKQVITYSQWTLDHITTQLYQREFCLTRIHLWELMRNK